MKKKEFEASCEDVDTISEQIADGDLHILVVEDDFGDYDDLKRVVRKMPTMTAITKCGRNIAEARKLLSLHSFDVILVDYMLGTESGVRVLDDLGGRTGRIPAILLTGMEGSMPQNVALEAGAISCINKDDLSPKLLETTIRFAQHTHRLETATQQVVDRFISMTEKAVPAA